MSSGCCGLLVGMKGFRFLQICKNFLNRSSRCRFFPCFRLPFPRLSLEYVLDPSSHHAALTCIEVPSVQIQAHDKGKQSLHERIWNTRCPISFRMFILLVPGSVSDVADLDSSDGGVLVAPRMLLRLLRPEIALGGSFGS